MANAPKFKEVACSELSKPVESFETESQNRLVIGREVLPIIFVPGIMGSRLGRSQSDKVWDPDSSWFMFTTYGRRKTNAAWKKDHLIGGEFDSDYLQVLNNDGEHNADFANETDTTRAQRGWGGVSWSSYGTILKELQTREWDPAVNLFFEFPVHAFGYNWTASNDLAGRKTLWRTCEMGATVTANNQTVVHKESGGTVVTSPDVCKTQVGNAVVPIPYVNTARSADTAKGSTTVTMDGNPVMLKTSVFSTSSGDEAGKIGGVSSGVTKGKAKFVTASNDVIVEGQPVGRRCDLMVSNLSASGNTPPAALMQPNVTAAPQDAAEYVLAIALQFKDPHVVTGRVTQPRIKLPYTVSGPDTYQYREEHFYMGVDIKLKQPGSYSFRFDDFDLAERPITQEAKDKGA